MATYYSPLSFFKGGKRRKTRKTRKTRKIRKPRSGGFYPSIMGGVVQTGAYLVPLAIRHGYNLLNNNKSLRKKNRK
jgi:hypothetical protein